MNSDCSRRAAHLLAICVDFKRSFGFHTEARALKIIHFADAQVAAKIDYGKHAGQLERINTADRTHVEMAIVDLAREEQSSSRRRKWKRWQKPPGWWADCCALPKCLRRPRGNLWARRDTSASRPTPATLQKYCGGPAGPGGTPAPSNETGVMTPRSMARTLFCLLQNRRQATSESRTPQMPSARAKSFPLPTGTISTGSFNFTNLLSWRWMVPSPPNSTMMST
jgi:hypothetical protein